MFERIRKMFGRKRAGLVDDGVALMDNVDVKLIKNGKVIKHKKYRNVWEPAGRNLIRNALTDGGFTAIGWMHQNGVGGVAAMATTPSKPADFQARFVAKWDSVGAITGISVFALRQTSAGANLATQTITPAFDKPDGLELEVTWTTTVSTS